MKVNVYDVICDPVAKLKLIKTINLRKDAFSTQDGTIDVMNKYFDMDKAISERVYAIGFQRDFIPTGVFFISSGTSDHCNVDIRKMFIGLLLSNSRRFACFHNHPSGIREISEDDVMATVKYNICGNSLGLEFMGHFMITRNYYTEIDNVYFEED